MWPWKMNLFPRLVGMFRSLFFTSFSELHLLLLCTSSTSFFTPMSSSFSSPPQRILLLFLHDAGSSGSDITSFFSSIPLESFGDKSFHEVTDMLGIQIVTPTARIQSNFFSLRKRRRRGIRVLLTGSGMRCHLTGRCWD